MSRRAISIRIPPTKCIELFHQLNRELGITLVIATHNEPLTRSMGRALRMREGHLIEERG